MSQSTSSILVVDDDPTFRQGLRASLKSSGYDVDAARNAEQALEYVRQRPVDVVLLDISMPGIGGWRHAAGFAPPRRRLASSCSQYASTRYGRRQGPCPGSR